MKNKIDLERIRARLNTDTGDLGFANHLQDAQFVGWYKQDIPALLSELTRLQTAVDTLERESDNAIDRWSQFAGWTE